MRALLAELVDARDSKSRSFGSACSTQAWGTISLNSFFIQHYQSSIVKRIGMFRPDFPFVTFFISYNKNSCFSLSASSTGEVTVVQTLLSPDFISRLVELKIASS